MATSLRMRYKSTVVDRLLTEAIDLYRESLALHLPGHPDRALSWKNLATSLWTCYTNIGESVLINEIYDLCVNGLSLSYSKEKWQHAQNLVWLHLHPHSPFRSPPLAIQYLSQCLEPHPGDVSDALASAIYCLDLF
jgi:hypothetical protein